MTLRIYNLIEPLVNNAGKIIQPWNSFFQQFTQQPAKTNNITVTASPFKYQAGEPGQVSLVGGTISALTLTRGTKTVDVTGLKLVMLEISDTLTVTYSVLPALTFFPRY